MLLPIIIGILLYGFWISPEFKEISAWVSIFLFGMLFLQDGFKAFTWGSLEKILHKSTNRTWKSLLFGFTSATIMQSSSLVSLLTISFLSAELITLVQWIWIIFWANIGTTTWAWLIAAFWMKINLSIYAMPILVFGLIFNLQKSKTLKWIGSILAWIGFLFLGIHYMKEWFEAFQSSINLIDYAMQWFWWILVFTWIWILATIVMQSSHATIILVIAALATGQVTYENSLALIIGANIGTTVTAILWSLTSNIDWKRLALSDVLFKITVWLVFIIFLPFISEFVNYFSTFIWIWEEDYTLKLALFHTLFNVLWLIIVIPFMWVLIKVIMHIFPNSVDNDNNSLYLNESVLDFPDTALITIMKETNHLYSKSIEMILWGFWLTIKDIENKNINLAFVDKIQISEIDDIEEVYIKKIKKLYSEILDYITNAESRNGKKYHNNFYILRDVNIKIIENIKIIDTLQKNLIKYTKSSNVYMKKEYNEMLIEIIWLIKDINMLQTTINNKERLIWIWRIRYLLEKKHTKTTNNIYKLIRNQSISSYMWSSLINDIHYKGKLFTNLFEISEVIFDNKILKDYSEGKVKQYINIENWFNNIFWLSDKKIEKVLNKIKKKKVSIMIKLEDESDPRTIKDMKNEIKIIDYTLAKYS